MQNSIEVEQITSKRGKLKLVFGTGCSQEADSIFWSSLGGVVRLRDRSRDMIKHASIFSVSFKIILIYSFLILPETAQKAQVGYMKR